MDYKNGKIYRIVCEETGLQYIGSTCSTLVKRLSGHKRNKRCACKDFINPKIFLIEDYPCDRKDQLLMRERFHMENVDCINMRKPIVSNQETTERRRISSLDYYHNNKEKTLEYRKKYREEHVEYKSLKASQKIICECGSIVARSSLTRHKKNKKHQLFINT